MNPEAEPSRAELDALQEPLLIEFGASYCGHCAAAQPLIAEALFQHPGVRRIKIEDGRGRPLGRSIRVKLWTTLIFLQEGQEIARLVRPTDSSAIGAALRQIDRAG